MSYYRGENCTCAAWHELECACGADWTDPVVYVLQDRVKELEEIIRGRDELIDNAVSNRIAEIEKSSNEYGNSPLDLQNAASLASLYKLERCARDIRRLATAFGMR